MQLRIHIKNETSKNLDFSLDVPEIYNINYLKYPIVSEDKIHEICIAEGYLIVLFADRGFRDGSISLPDEIERKENNVIAYDWEGKKLWNIGEIIGDIRDILVSIGFISKEQAEEFYGGSTKGCGDILLHCTDWLGRHYIIDVANRRELTITKNKATK